MGKVRLGIIGMGNMGSGHAKNIIDGLCSELEITAVADLKETRRQWCAKHLPPSVQIFSSAEELLDSGSMDAILIAVPHYDHPKYAITGFAHRLHVMVEKPAGVYTRQVREMNRMAKQYPELVFGMMFNQRTDHIYRKMREIVQSGALGQIRRTNWLITNWYRPQAYYDSGAWRATWSGEGGGVLLNQCPHQLDLWQWICGMPVKVYAHMLYGKWHNIEVEDDVTAYVRYANGATGTFITSTGDPCGTNRFEIILDKGKLVAEDGKLLMWETDIPEPEFSETNTNPFASPKVQIRQVQTDGKSGQHAEVMNCFAAAILRHEPLIADGSEGINGLTISNAMHLSSWLNREIDLPFDEDLYYEALMKRVKISRRKECVREATSEIAAGHSSFQKTEPQPDKDRWKVNW